MIDKNFRSAWIDAAPRHAYYSWSQPCTQDDIASMRRSMETQEPITLLGLQMIVSGLTGRIGSNVVSIQARLYVPSIAIRATAPPS